MSHAYFPGVPRPHQDALFTQITEALPWASLIVINAAVATGKTWMAIAISRLAADNGLTSTIAEPDNVLLGQLADEFPELAVPRNADSYRCRKHAKPCSRVKTSKCKVYCEDCPYVRNIERVRGSYQRAMKYHSLMGTRRSIPTSDVLIIDEAHKLVDMLDEQSIIRLWQHEYKWPSDLRDTHDLLLWTEQSKLLMPPAQVKKIAAIRSMILRAPDDVFMSTSVESYRGKPDTVLTIRPRFPKDKTWLTIPRKVKTIVLMSATIGQHDLHELGLDVAHRGKTLFLEVPSPIPPERRPIVPVPSVNMSHAIKPLSIMRMAELLEQTAAKHPNQAGIIHTTYEDMQLYKTLLHGDRWVYHNQDNRLQVFERWKSGGYGPNAIFLAAGFHEGVNLVEDIARWQVITKIPYPYLGDPYVKWKSEKDVTWYNWQTVKRLLQAFGRVCRTPTDYGVTYVYDTAFPHLYKAFSWMFPQHVKDSIVWS